MASRPAFDFYCEEALSGKTKLDIVYESKHVLAFYHTKPMYEKHIVVISKKHVQDFASVEDEDLTVVNEIIRVARDLVRTFDYAKKGARVVTNLGIFEDSPHLHFHVIMGKMIKKST